MKTFDEWFKDNELNGWADKGWSMVAYEAGAASKQAEINNLKQSHHGASIGHDVFIKQLKERHKAEIDELKWMLKNSNGQADEFARSLMNCRKGLMFVKSCVILSLTSYGI